MFDFTVDLVLLQPESQIALAAAGCGIFITPIDCGDVRKCDCTQVFAGGMRDTSLFLLVICIGLRGAYRLHCLLGLVLQRPADFPWETACASAAAQATSAVQRDTISHCNGP